METETPRCARCRNPFLPEQDTQKYCSAACRESAKKRRQRFRLRHGKDAGELLGPPGTRAPGDGDGDLDDETGIHYGDAGREPAWAEQDRRINAMLTEDQGRRHARSQRSMRRSWERFRGVEDQSAAQERSDRYEAEQRAIQTRLASSTVQPESRFNGATRGAVASRGAESRQLNRRAATGISVPSAAQGYVFIAPEPAAMPRPGAPRDGDFFRY